MSVLAEKGFKKILVKYLKEYKQNIYGQWTNILGRQWKDKELFAIKWGNTYNFGKYRKWEQSKLTFSPIMATSRLWFNY